jgi:hypothetical protein
VARLRALVALLLATLCSAPALAQSLQRLTVTQLTLSSDVASPKVEVPFDLIVTAHVRERVTELRNLDLPTLAEVVELLGDEHSIVNNADGTTYTERVRVVAHHGGVITIAPVTLDAIDARDGKAKRFSSNALSLNVGGVAPPLDGFTWTQEAAETLRTVLTWVVAIAALALIVVLLFRRRRAQPLVPPPEPQPVPGPRPALTREQRLRDARTVLEVERTRGAVLRVRTMVREMVGADDAETLADVLRRIGPDERLMRALLFALERAAFTHDGDLNRAVDQVIVRLDEILA